MMLPSDEETLAYRFLMHWASFLAFFFLLLTGHAPLGVEVFGAILCSLHCLAVVLIGKEIR